MRGACGVFAARTSRQADGQGLVRETIEEEEEEEETENSPTAGLSKMGPVGLEPTANGL